MAITYYSANRILNLNFGNTSYVVPTPLYFGLSTTPINIDGTGASEPLGAAGYARVGLANADKTNWSVSTLGSLANTAAGVVQFPESTASWGTISHVFIADAAGIGAGNIWWWDVLSPTRLVQPATTVLFAAGAITVVMNNT